MSFLYSRQRKVRYYSQSFSKYHLRTQQYGPLYISMVTDFSEEFVLTMFRVQKAQRRKNFRHWRRK